MPTALPVNVAGIPAALKAETRWVLWRYLARGDKFTKTPMQASGRYAKPNDSSTWATFDDAVAAYLRLHFDGLGFMLGDGWAGIDDDDGSMPLITDAYVEVSPSKNGRKFFGRGRLSVEFKGGRVTKKWTGARFFAVTGHGHGDVMVDVPVDQLVIEQAVPDYITIGDQRGINHNAIPSPFPKCDDDGVITLILASAQAGKFASLMRGELDDYDDDHSKADLALCSLLMYWTQNDREQTDRIFRDSKLCREKWTDRDDYRTWTLDKAAYR